MNFLVGPFFYDTFALTRNTHFSAKKGDETLVFFNFILNIMLSLGGSRRWRCQVVHRPQRTFLGRDGKLMFIYGRVGLLSGEINHFTGKVSSSFFLLSSTTFINIVLAFMNAKNLVTRAYLIVAVRSNEHSGAILIFGSALGGVVPFCRPRNTQQIGANVSLKKSSKGRRAGNETKTMMIHTSADSSLITKKCG